MTRILVVEDEPAIAFGLQSDLTLEGYSVEIAADGVTAVRRASETSFDLILLDVLLPKKDGFTVCRDLRRTGVRTPIIMLTARTQEAEKVLGFGLGADDYVTKPFSPLELCARIKAVLRRTGPTDLERCRFGSIEVDFARGIVRRNSDVIDLTPLELKLLAALIRADGRLLTRDRLIDDVWGPGVSLSGRVVDNHIMNLRRKVEDNPAEPRYVVSVRGLGYRFEKPDEIEIDS